MATILLVGKLANKQVGNVRKIKQMEWKKWKQKNDKMANTREKMTVRENVQGKKLTRINLDNLIVRTSRLISTEFYNRSHGSLLSIVFDLTRCFVVPRDFYLIDAYETLFFFLEQETSGNFRSLQFAGKIFKHLRICFYRYVYLRVLYKTSWYGDQNVMMIVIKRDCCANL